MYARASLRTFCRLSAPEYDRTGSSWKSAEHGETHTFPLLYAERHGVLSLMPFLSMMKDICLPATKHEEPEKLRYVLF